MASLKPSTHSTKLTVLYSCHVFPFHDSDYPLPEFSLPLTYFDTFWFKFPPVELLFFYKLAELTRSHFDSVILPQLKHSLSLTLFHFLPLAGTLSWPQNEAIPIIRYALNDAVLFTVAESSEDLNFSTNNKPREASLSRMYIPNLPVSDSKAAAIAFQITLFPNQGFSIGISLHKAVLDGKSFTIFMKAWAYTCKLLHNNGPDHDLKVVNLPRELKPFWDRTVIRDTRGLVMEFLKNWPDMDPNNPRSLKLLVAITDIQNSVRATFMLSRQDVNKIKEMVISSLMSDETEEHKIPNQTKQLDHLSTFVLVSAYTLVSIVRAKNLKNTRVNILITADCRQLLHPPIHQNYIGNCITGRSLLLEAASLVNKNGVTSIVKGLNDLRRGLVNHDVFEGLKEKFKQRRRFAMDKEKPIVIMVAGSTQFGFYETDFGWGKPVKMEPISIDRTGAVFLTESSDGSGGVEIHVVLEKHEMEVFGNLFVDGVKDCCFRGQTRSSL